MFKVNEYKIVFKRIWHERVTDINGAYVYGNGRYDTVCEIYVHQTGANATETEPHFTGIARLHPNDTPDKIVGKKIALRNAMFIQFGDSHKIDLDKLKEIGKEPIYRFKKEVRTAIWGAFWAWVKSWELQNQPY